MTLAKKGSRLIHVAGEVYQWATSCRAGRLSLVAERASGAGQRLKASMDDRRLWATGSASTGGRFKVRLGETEFTPGLVQRVMFVALEAGWQPQTAGPPFEIQIQDDLAVAGRGVMQGVHRQAGSAGLGTEMADIPESPRLPTIEGTQEA